MGRYSHPKTPPDERLCYVCCLKEPEDEFHFVMRCSLYDDIRNVLLSTFGDMFNLDTLSEQDIFNLLMSANNFDSVFAVFKFISSAFEKRSAFGKDSILSSNSND